MNVLILTPDRVGSTLLQRVLTIYMQMQNFDRPVINLHELTNGLMKYYSPVFNNEVLGRSNAPRGYYQSLSEIIDLLTSCDHYKTSRLAHYHIKNRQDTMAQQMPFYQYLNDNFFIISARRENLLEHTLSWCIYTHSKKLNVYSHSEKFNTFQNIYQNKITVSPMSIVKYLDQYADYLKWVDNHFAVGSYFEYEKDLPRIEQYVLDLPVFDNQPRLTWADTFDIDFKQWNQCHYLLSDLSGISQQISHANPLQLEYNLLQSVMSHELAVPSELSQVSTSLAPADQQFLMDHGKKYTTAHAAIEQLVSDKILASGIPIKLQTFLEKKLLIKNFNQCVDVYNEWVSKNQIGKHYTEEQLAINIQKELSAWHARPTLAE
jgi:hypothetical protein